MNEIIAMNGYGPYIWSSYGVSAILLIILLRNSLARLKKIKQQCKEEISEHVT